MILYTTVPSEMIFPEDEAQFKNQQTLEIDGGLLVVEPVSSHEYKVIRLISSDPSLYLNEKYTPGQIISTTPQL